MKLGFTIDELKVGQSVFRKKHITKNDVEQFGALINDFNPAHFDAEYAKKTMFNKRISHGMYIGSLFSKLIGMDLPGKGSIYVNQTLTFLKPVYFDDEITATITVKQIDIKKNRINLETIATNQRNEKVITGEAIVMPPKEREING
ncbi:MAG: MaoC family dehydratase [Candidatus Izimaplasma sp.]|nr:MaoC family dehydratase [Candidatus Izimaplasma bacterium]